MRSPPRLQASFLQVASQYRPLSFDSLSTKPSHTQWERDQIAAEALYEIGQRAEINGDHMARRAHNGPGELRPAPRRGADVQHATAGAKHGVLLLDFLELVD